MTDAPVPCPRCNQETVPHCGAGHKTCTWGTCTKCGATFDIKTGHISGTDYPL